MIPEQEKYLQVLDNFSQPQGEMCLSFAPIEQETGYDRRTVRRNVRALARKGLAEYHRGLWSEDGKPAGAGYCITDEGRAALSPNCDELAEVTIRRQRDEWPDPSDKLSPKGDLE